jgi:hypothetical protein
MALAKERGVYLVRLAKERFGTDKLTALTTDERVALYAEMLTMPAKGA